MKNIVAFAGSNNPQSINHQLLLAATKKLNYASVHVLILADFTAPMYSESLEKELGIPHSIVNLHQILTEADGFIIACPEHNGLLPAFFKNIIDWLSRIDQKIFRHKPLLMISTSPGKNGGATNLQTLANLLPWWGAVLTGTYSLSLFHKHFDNQHMSIHDPAEDQKLTDAVELFLQHLAEPNLV